MTNITFIINEGKTPRDYGKPQTIYLRYRLSKAKIDFKASLGVKVMVHPTDEKRNDWDISKQRVKSRTHIHNRHEINSLLDNMVIHFNKFDSENKQNGIIPTYKQVRKHFDSYFYQPEENQNPDTLFSYIDYLINRPETKRNLKEGSIKNFRLTQTFLKRFNDEVYQIDFDTINIEWYNDFVEWCESQNLSKNYIGKHIKTLKTFLNNAVEDNKTDNLQFKSKKFKTLKETADNVYLSIDELYQLWDLELSHEPRMENARDLFLIGAFTGLRVSDYNNIKPENIITVEGEELIRIKTKKTGQVVAIPLHPIVKEILEKNNGNPPPRIPDQNINYLIKEVSQNAGIDETTHITITKGGKEVSIKKHKFELVKTHTARRSFCTNAYLTGIPTLDIMAISGHTSEKTFLNYIKVTPEQHAMKMSKHIFFQGRTKLKAV